MTSGQITLIGLGPSGWDQVSEAARAALLDPDTAVVLRTADHPAAAHLADLRQVTVCDDLYESFESFDDVYRRIVERVLLLAADGPVAYAVPGSVAWAERSAAAIRRERPDVAVIPGTSFVDHVLLATGIDPFDRGLQVLDAHALPEPLLLQVPTIIGQIDSELGLFDVRDRLLRLLPADEPMWVLTDVGGPDETIERIDLSELTGRHAGLRTSLAIEVPDPPGWPGLVATNARLRAECPWDAKQTHHTLAQHLIEEAYEVIDALEGLTAEAPAGEPDVPAYLEVEEELGDLLLQVVFHATLAAEAGMFDTEEVAERIRRKLVHRHPHVFGDVTVESHDELLANWERLKGVEKERSSLMDGVPTHLPALARANKLQERAAGVGFDWPELDGVIAKVHEELDEVLAADSPEDRASEVGDLLFSVVNLARHLGVDPEQALRGSVGRFSSRFRVVEDGGDLGHLSLEEMDRRWDRAKAGE